MNSLDIKEIALSTENDICSTESDSLDHSNSELVHRSHTIDDFSAFDYYKVLKDQFPDIFGAETGVLKFLPLKGKLLVKDEPRKVETPSVPPPSKSFIPSMVDAYDDGFHIDMFRSHFRPIRRQPSQDSKETRKKNKSRKSKHTPASQIKPIKRR